MLQPMNTAAISAWTRGVMRSSCAACADACTGSNRQPTAVSRLLLLDLFAGDNLESPEIRVRRVDLEAIVVRLFRPPVCFGDFDRDAEIQLWIRVVANRESRRADTGRTVGDEFRGEHAACLRVDLERAARHQVLPPLTGRPRQYARRSEFLEGDPGPGHLEANA